MPTNNSVQDQNTQKVQLGHFIQFNDKFELGNELVSFDTCQLNINSINKTLYLSVKKGDKEVVELGKITRWKLTTGNFIIKGVGEDYSSVTIQFAMAPTLNPGLVVTIYISNLEIFLDKVNTTNKIVFENLVIPK